MDSAPTESFLAREPEADHKRAKPSLVPPLRHCLALLSVSLFSFGAHVAYKSLSGIEHFLKKDLDTDSTGYGTLNSAVSWSSLACLPFVFGLLIDGFPSRYSGLALALVVTIGQLIFSLSVRTRSRSAGRSQAAPSSASGRARCPSSRAPSPSSGSAGGGRWLSRSGSSR